MLVLTDHYWCAVATAALLLLLLLLLPPPIRAQVFYRGCLDNSAEKHAMWPPHRYVVSAVSLSSLVDCWLTGSLSG